MIEDFVKFMCASEDERIAAFERAAAAHDTIAPNVEKDLWVCCVLDLLFNGRPTNEPRLFFKGGTSLSKSFDLIYRFSEDIDIGVFKEDIGAPSEEEIATISTITQRQKAIENQIDYPSQQFFSERLKPQIKKALDEIALECGFSEGSLRVELDIDKRTQKPLPEVLLVRYPTVFPDASAITAVKIEGGARPRSAPADTTTVTPI